MQGGKIGQISGYYPDASPINQASLSSGAVDNSRDDANAILHFVQNRSNLLQKSVYFILSNFKDLSVTR